MVRHPLRLLTAAALVTVAACGDNPPTSPDSNAPSQAVGKHTGSYILLAESETSLPAGLESAVADAGGEVARSHPRIGIAVVRSADPDFAAQARRIPGVRSVTPDAVRRWQPRNPRVMHLDAAQALAPRLKAEVASIGDDETFFFLQWAHPVIQAPEAWNTGAHGAGARVAILDGGIDADHEDLAANLDLPAGRSFIEGVSDPYTDIGGFWHGTHVAGIVAAADNGLGVIGVAPEATLIGVKVLHDGSGTIDGLIEGILYAATPIADGGAGADILNMSLSAVFQPSSREDAELIAALGRVTNFAYHLGATLIAAASNDALDLDANPTVVVIPAMSPRVIAVSALGPVGWALGATNFDRLASYSNFGLRIIDLAGHGGDFVLPGEDLCTVGFVTVPCWVFDLILSTNVGDVYTWAAGTSMAAPQVSGVAALIVENAGGSLHPQAVQAALRRSSEDLGAPGKDAIYGWGRVNAFRAVD